MFPGGGAAYAIFWNKHHLSLQGYQRTFAVDFRNKEVNRRWALKKLMVGDDGHGRRWSKAGGLKAQVEKVLKKSMKVAYGSETTDTVIVPPLKIELDSSKILLPICSNKR